MKNSIIMLITDIVLAAAILLAIWIFNYKIPQKGIPAPAVIDNSILPQNNNELILASNTDKNVLSQVNNTEDTADWKEKFADKFSDTVISTESVYKSPYISIELTKGTLDTNKLDYSANGKHKKYGTSIKYTVADIYIGDISCFKTAFAKDTYGIGYSEKLTDMSKRIKSILAVNGDSYNNNRHKNSGTIIRNGVIYRSAPTNVETCVLNIDGTMKIYLPDEIDEQTLIENGAYQSWIFGPSLLDENGKAKTDFLTWDYIKQSHPRTAIGYYEPGHYCLLVVDGRQKNYSRGMFLDEMSQLFESLGCKAAYNLDGGHCSFITFGDKVASHPYKPEHEIPDGIFITEALK